LIKKHLVRCRQNGSTFLLRQTRGISTIGKVNETEKKRVKVHRYVLHGKKEKRWGSLHLRQKKERMNWVKQV